MKKWRFISNQNSQIVGINDAGIETFTANIHRSLVREIIQNSLDAALPESTEPVEVEFVLFDLPMPNMPDADAFRAVLRKCKESNMNEPEAFKFFKNAEELASRDILKVLRISDHKTIGLEGSDTCKKGTGWSRLVKESGSSNKGEGSGGSFGIGKAAAFACSDLRTVFYSSLDSKGLKSNFGVAKLISFQDDELGGWTTGIGYYSEDDKFLAIPEMAEFDAEYERKDTGTDIYIMGMHQVSDIKTLFINAVLLDFLVSLVKGKLVVNVQGEIIDKNSLPSYMAALNPYESEEIRDLLEYYHLLTSSDPKIKKINLDAKVYGEEYGFKDGECTLYLREGEGLNRKIMITRKAGMRILEQNRISGSIEFSGVLVIEGSNMNEAFKKMEVPSHDAWEPGRCRGEENKYNNILRGLRKYLRDIVKECYGKVATNSMDAIGASDFLPDRPEGESSDELQKNDFSTRIKKLLGKSVEPTTVKSKAVEVAEVDSEKNGNGGNSRGVGKGNGGSGEHPGMGQASGRNGGKVGPTKGYKPIPVKKRLICEEALKGLYTLNMIVPSNANRGKLEFTLSGEQSDFKLPLQGAKVISEGVTTKIDAIEDNVIFLKGMTKGQAVKIAVQVDFDEYCMMGVDYYADKK